MAAYKALLLTVQISVGLGLRIVDIKNDSPVIKQSLLYTDHEQYAPEYSYDKQSVKNSQISKLSWAISPKLLPPPPPTAVATEDNADEFYKPYFGANIRADEGRETYDADSYYLPYYADKMSDP